VSFFTPELKPRAIDSAIPTGFLENRVPELELEITVELVMSYRG
jgi:hypothetical protein